MLLATLECMSCGVLTPVGWVFQSTSCLRAPHSPSLREAGNEYFHFTSERTKAQKDLASCHGSHSKGRGSENRTKT